jgi:ketosteroid isomerase-like protein
MTTTTEQEIRAVIDERVAAVQAKDAGPLAAREADDVVTFDVLPPRGTRRPVRA